MLACSNEVNRKRNLIAIPFGIHVPKSCCLKRPDRMPFLSLSLLKATSMAQATFGTAVVVLAVRLKAERRLSARKGECMKSNLMKRVFAAAFSFALLIGAGSLVTTTAQAQDRGRDRNWQRDRDDRRDNDRDWNRDSNWRRQQIERQRQIERERELARQRAWERNRSYRSYPNGGYGGYGGGYGGYGNYGGGYGGQSNYEVQRGYRDGLDRGQEDARDRRSPNPNNSSHFRSGNSAYRSGFVRGYQEGYRQYGGYRRW